MKRSLILFVSMLLFFLCEFSGNMYNPDDPSYVQPSFTVDSVASNFADGDTISGDTLRITLIGNDDARLHNQFRWSLDNGKWSAWGGEGKTKYPIVVSGLSGLSSGSHTITIEVCYTPGEEKIDSTITFVRASKPVIADVADTLLTVDAEAACTLWVKAEGIGAMKYAWYRGSKKLDSATTDSLILKNVSLADTGVYTCRVTSAWGETKSPGIRLRVRFRVFYDGNGNTGGEVPEDTIGYEPGAIATTAGNPGSLARRGYSFTGWNTEAGGSGDTRDSADIFKIDTMNVTLYAEWNPNSKFTLAYDGNGATGGKVPDTTRSYRTGELIAVSGNSGNLVNSGYTFTGWKTSADGSGQGYAENDSLEMGDKDVTLYAQWSDNPTFTVSYDKNSADNGTVPADAKKYEEGDTVTVAGNSGNLTKEDNTFTGWNTEAEGDDGIAYTPGATFVMGTKSVKLYARWTTNPTHTVTYLGNGNTAGTPAASVSNIADAEVTIAGEGTLVKKGHSFTGWNTSADGSGDAYGKNSTYTMTDYDDTLYAQWEINRYTVSYDGNGDDVSGVPPQTTHRYNTELTLAAKAPTRSGYTFFRWNTTAEGDGEDYQPGDKFTIGDENVTFYARWTVTTSRLTYNANGATGGTVPAAEDPAFGESVTVAGKGSLVRTGSSFTGWNTKADGSGTGYSPDATFSMGTGDMELFAQWRADRFIVTFDSRGGSEVGTQELDFGSHATEPDDPARTGYDFEKWYRDDAYTTAWVFATDIVEEEVTLYAKWTIVEYPITYNLNGGTNGDNPASYTIESATTDLSEPTKTSYTFDGWYNTESFTGEKVTSISEGSSGNRQFWAKWIITDIDGNRYTEVTIGNQVWMVENLKTTKFRDGTSIPEAREPDAWEALTTPGYCWYSNSNSAGYGILYNWFTAADTNTRKLAPVGWHIPGESEWNALISNTGGLEVAGGKLKETTTAHWNSPNGGATNESGFTALPGGRRISAGTPIGFNGIGSNGYWWSSTDKGSATAGSYNMNNLNPIIERTNSNHRDGFSVRCIRD